MIENHVDEWDIENAVAVRGYFPGDMHVWEYPEDFITGCLIDGWKQLYAIIEEAKKEGGIVFS